MPFFDFLFTGYRSEGVIVALEPNQKVDMVSGCEAAHRVGPMLVCAADKIVGYTDIEGSVFAAGHEINVVHGPMTCGYGFRARA